MSRAALALATFVSLTSCASSTGRWSIPRPFWNPSIVRKCQQGLPGRQELVVIVATGDGAPFPGITVYAAGPGSVGNWNEISDTLDECSTSLEGRCSRLVKPGQWEVIADMYPIGAYGAAIDIQSDQRCTVTFFID
jgi:hypothetical protein